MKRATRAQRIEKLAVYLAWNDSTRPLGYSPRKHWRALSGTGREGWAAVAKGRFDEMRRAGLVVRLRGEKVDGERREDVRLHGRSNGVCYLPNQRKFRG